MDDTFVPQRGTVILKGKRFEKRVQIDAMGNYQITVPAGVYRITTEIPDHFPFRRAAFSVQPNESVIINIVPLSRIRAAGTKLTASGLVTEPVALAPVPRYDRFVMPPAAKLSGEMIIRFDKRRRRKGVIEYTFAQASFDALTVYANVIRFDPKRLVLIAEGGDILTIDGKPQDDTEYSSVDIEDGKQSMNVKHAVISLKSGKPIVKLIQ